MLGTTPVMANPFTGRSTQKSSEPQGAVQTWWQAAHRDQMLDNISLYWHRASAASSARLYREDSFARPYRRGSRPADTRVDGSGEGVLLHGNHLAVPPVV